MCVCLSVNVHIYLLYIYPHSLASLFIMSAWQTESEPRKLVYVLTYIPVMGPGTMAAFESDRNILRHGNKAVIERGVTCVEVEMFSLSLFLPYRPGETAVSTRDSGNDIIRASDCFSCIV